MKTHGPVFLSRAFWVALFVVLAMGQAPTLFAQGSHRDYEEVEANLTVSPIPARGSEISLPRFLPRWPLDSGDRSPEPDARLLHGHHRRRRLEDHGRRPQLDQRVRRFLRRRSDRRHRGGRFRPERRLRRNGFGLPSRQHLRRATGSTNPRTPGRHGSTSGSGKPGQIGKIRIHPNNPDLVYVAALGHIFGPNEERGVFRSKDGGETWEKVFYISEETGVVDLSMDVTNPRILYAGAWRAERKPWSVISGSEEGGIFKTTDGGDNWVKLEGGLPTGMVGRTSVSVSPANPNRVWVLIEAEGESGGVYRSEDGGESWHRINGDANLRQRPWYYIHIFADPKDENIVYALNTGFYKSVDGGKTFDIQIEDPHGDNHDLWINPNDNQIMVNANDGGGNVSFNGGQAWSDADESTHRRDLPLHRGRPVAVSCLRSSAGQHHDLRAEP